VIQIDFLISNDRLLVHATIDIGRQGSTNKCEFIIILFRCSVLDQLDWIIWITLNNFSIDLKSMRDMLTLSYHAHAMWAACLSLEEIARSESL